VSCHSGTVSNDQPSLSTAGLDNMYGSADGTQCLAYSESDREYSSVWASDADHKRSMIGSAQAWSAQNVAADGNDHVTLDLKYNRKVLGVVTQGRHDQTQYVKKFKVQYALNNNNGNVEQATWYYIYTKNAQTNALTPRVFTGNVHGNERSQSWKYFNDDHNGTLTLFGITAGDANGQHVDRADGIKARWLRIIPTEAAHHVSMRVGPILAGNADGVYMG